MKYGTRLLLTYQYVRACSVRIISINIISAKPADQQLMNSLAKGAVAAAEAYSGIDI